VSFFCRDLSFLIFVFSNARCRNRSSLCLQKEVVDVLQRWLYSHLGGSVPTVSELAQIEQMTALNRETVQNWIRFSLLTWASEGATPTFGFDPRAERPFSSPRLPSFGMPLLTKHTEAKPAALSLSIPNLNLPVCPLVDAGPVHQPCTSVGEAKPVLALPPLWIAFGLPVLPQTNSS
jgi:hypothetical protein